MTDKEIIEAFLEEIHLRGWSIDTAAKALNISRSTFFNWQKGEKISNKGRAALSLFISEEKSNVSKPDTSTIRDFPVITEAAAATCNTAYYPIGEWAEEYSEGRVSFSEGREGDFVVRVTGESMLPWYPADTLILVRPNQRPANGDRVIAVLGDGSVVFKVFAEKGEKFFLMSVNAEDGRDFSFSKSDYAAVRSVYLVIQSMRDERALDRAMSAKGIRHGWQERLNNL